MKTVILAEKPDQGRKFANALGKTINKGTHCIVDSDIISGDVVVTWGIGHLVGLAEPESYSSDYKKWSMDKLPILPDKMKFQVNKRTSKQFNVVKNLLQKADSIIIATDPDREGENIAYSILMMCGKDVINKLKKRLWINSLQKKEIRRGFQNLRDSKETYNYYKEAQTRQISDWLVGMNYTRYLSILMQQKGLKGVWSVGRVQTPTNTLICQNYLERKNFEPKPYWLLKGIQENEERNIDFIENKKDTKYFDKQELEQFITKHQLNSVEEALVKDVKKRKKSTKAPTLFSLGGLQGFCSSKFGWTVSKTLKVMQILYDKGHVSYPRTSSSLITTNEFKYLRNNLEIYKKIVNVNFDNDNMEPRKTYVDNEKVLEHYAIIPTEDLPVIDKLTDDQKKLYISIVNRTIMMFAGDYEYEQTTVLVNANDVEFKTTGSVPIKNGWKDVGVSLENEDDNKTNQTLPHYVEGNTIPFFIQIEEKETTPPQQITEAQLVKENGVMEKLGLGTEATRSSIIETLKNREYIKNDGKTKLIPTEKGLILYEITQDTLIGNPEMTAKWEEYLVLIGEGKKQPDPFIQKVKGSIEPTFDKINQQNISTKQVDSVKNQNILKIGNYTVLEKKNLYEVTPEGEKQHFPV